MAAAGFVYVLVNSSMPGLVKVGKTTRSVAERCTELNNATGVPTPFIAAYEQFFVDCDSAERAMHAELGRAGLRQTANREFFRASPNEVIRLLMMVPGATSPTACGGLDAPKGEPWRGLFEEAMSLADGDNIFRDPDEAKRLFVSAGQLGAPTAFREAGLIDAHREPPNVSSAVAHFRRGGEQGDYGCYSALARLFDRQGRVEDACAAWDIYFTHCLNLHNRSVHEMAEFESECQSYVLFCLRRNLEPSQRTGLEFAASAIAKLKENEIMHDAVDSVAKPEGRRGWLGKLFFP